MSIKPILARSSVMEDDLAFDDLTTSAQIEAPILAPR